MTEPASSKISVKTENAPQLGASSGGPATWRPFETLRHEIDRLFEDFGRDWRSPFRRSFFDPETFLPRSVTFSAVPATDIADKEKAYEITAELPGLDEQDFEVKVADGTLFIRGEKAEEKVEKEKDYFLKERSYGSFERSFRLPDDVDAEKIEARFAKGVLSVTLPKRPSEQKPEKKIEIKAA